VIGLAAVAFVAFRAPITYAANAVLLPPQQQQNAVAGALAQLSSLSNITGVSSGVKTPEDMYIALFKTRKVEDAVINKHRLKDYYHATTMTEARAALEAHTFISYEKKTGFITVEVREKTPEFASTLANAHVEALQELMASVAITEAQQRRRFLEQQVNKTRTALSNAETRFRKEQQAHGLVVTQVLAESTIKAAAELRAQITNRQVTLQAISKFATPLNQEVQRLTSELDALKMQLKDVEKGSDTATGDQTHKDAVQAFRDMKVQEAALDVLTRQLEIAKIDEAREGPMLQILDSAIPPEKPLQSKRGAIMLAGSSGVLLLSMVLAIGLGAIRQLPSESRAAWGKLVATWRWKPEGK
jgi:capsule polysaccharide export protein KpsE/RkpR